MNVRNGTRRGFFCALGGLSTSAWLASTWLEIAAAAEHAAHVATTTPAAFGFLTPEDAADVEAIAAQILPGGRTPGAREAHAVYFIDRALDTFFSDRALSFHTGLADFRGSFHRFHPAGASFAALSSGDQIAFLTSVQGSEFFGAMRLLTILGTLSSSRYGGNYEDAGWKLMGFEDQHVFSPPFGYYDRDYPGFVAGVAGGKT
jgi:gluconate 2-dehydrogenase subunit 3-like protein